MKRVFTCAVAALFVLAAYGVFLSYSQYDFEQKAGLTDTLFTLDKGTMEDERFLETIQALSLEHDVVVVTSFFPNYTSVNRNQAFTGHLFTNNFQLYGAMLSSGRLPENAGEYLASSFVEAENITGIVPLFNTAYSLEIHRLDESFPYSFSREYSLYGNPNAITAFMHGLQERGINCQKSFYGKGLRSLLGFQVVIYALAFVAVAIWSAYLIIGQYRYFGVRKLMGHRAVRIALSTVVSRVLVPCAVAMGGILVLSTVFFYFYNRWVGFALYSLLWLCVVLATILVLLVGDTVFALIVVGFIRAGEAIKGMGRTRALIVVSSVAKSVIGVFLLFFLLTLQYYVGYEQNLNLGLATWDILKEYGELPVYTVPSVENDYLLGLKCKALFAEENARGAILVRPDGLLTMQRELFTQEDFEVLTNPEHKYFWRNHGVQVNNNYLQINPIYDAQGNRVDLKQYENSEHLIILVPEKYKEYEATILEDFTETYNWSYSIDYLYYMAEVGQPAEEQEIRRVEIIYTQNNSYYFSFNPLYEGDKAYYFIDPIGVVVNNVNFGGDTYYSAVSTGEFKVLLREGTSISPYREVLGEVGLDKNIIEVRNAYDRVSRMLYIIKQNQANNSLLAALLLLALLGITAFTSILVCEASKRAMNVKYLLGYPLLKRSTPVLLVSAASWLCTIGLYILFFSTGVLPVLVFSGVLLLLDLSICLMATKLFSNRKTWREEVA